jgi:hypothetical protein
MAVLAEPCVAKRASTLEKPYSPSRRETMGALHRTSWVLVCIAVAIGLVACNGPQGSTSPSKGVVSIPTSDLSAFQQCMLTAGFTVGGSSGEWIAGPDVRNAMGAMQSCRDRYAPYVEKTTEEIRAVYERWIGEYQCLVGLGYKPAEPPTEETFVQSWTTGPWMPIDGVSTISWSDEQYGQAKQKCGLEMYDR